MYTTKSYLTHVNTYVISLFSRVPNNETSHYHTPGYPLYWYQIWPNVCRYFRRYRVINITLSRQMEFVRWQILPGQNIDYSHVVTIENIALLSLDSPGPGLNELKLKDQSLTWKKRRDQNMAITLLLNILLRGPHKWTPLYRKFTPESVLHTPDASLPDSRLDTSVIFRTITTEFLMLAWINQVYRRHTLTTQQRCTNRSH